MKKLLIALMTTTAALSLAASAEAADKLKACWVYTGPIGDFGYSYQHDQGRLEVEKALGDKVETAYLENVSEGPDADRAFERLAREGCKLIFGTSFGFMDAEVKVAKKFPKVMFEHATGYKTGDNLGIYNARFYEGRYVLGQIAAKESKSGVAGYIVSFPIPEVVMGINSFMLGAQSINPNFKAKIVWVNSWFDPGKEADAAKALFDQGADIIVQHTDSTAALQVAEERKLHGFGQSSDMIKFAPNAQLTSLTDEWGPYYISRVQAAIDGTWKPDNVWLGIKDGAVKLAPYTNMPDDVKAMAEATEKKIAGGWNPFTGPIAKQDGSAWLKDGEVADDGTLLGMNFYVKGVDDKLPQ
ncbi:BMP family ABC transporter substrate-binding protein [Mesorhizobium sp. SEMIA 3007]|jgi:simple sugar transport system substrate-binding protein|uniref:BMP family ABC transporter substrate-binding protein n=1 Tax=Mesorhizobium huakuii TaxID=28104 RepID=A0A7G6T0Q6_9HYPH|nr:MULTISPECIES: BMP family ABC transporter substrate-binding protein [Mesorhizobium]BAV45302.1 bmp family protein [Mesorhizobium loti]MCH4558270.1 BMP family ABC transporter substrate-binding protein [Mesorhizobium jarvisii]ODA95157.1 BMP family ABC transporter substrate-binding protein [Mesorhizobium sp. SEMIA 3007]QND60338.1 BMP family ABC transporter substrate-binding protein [Mesorhizobium huakuii]TSE03762.1 BMP family ABC transporter substrate-binding protein [Mesorhizobium intechi]